jgi:hypothetical protein
MHPHIHPSIHPSIISIHPSIHSCMRTCLHTLPFLSLPWLTLHCITMRYIRCIHGAWICTDLWLHSLHCVVRFPLYIQQTCWDMWRLFSFGYLYFCSCEGVPPRQIVKVFPLCKRYPEESWKLGLDSEACTCAKTILHFVAVLCCLCCASFCFAYLLPAFPVAGVSLAICNEFSANCPWEPQLH